MDYISFQIRFFCLSFFLVVITFELNLEDVIGQNSIHQSVKLYRKEEKLF